MQARWFLLASLLFAPAIGAAHTESLDIVVVEGQVPGLHGDELSRAILHSVQHVAPHDMVLEVAPKGPLPPNRIEWRFHANPYAGGAVRYIGPARSAAERLFGVHRQVTAEAKLFLDGQFQSVVLGQANLTASDEANFTTLVEGLATTLLHTPHG